MSVIVRPGDKVVIGITPTEVHNTRHIADSLADIWPDVDVTVIAGSPGLCLVYRPDGAA